MSVKEVYDKMVCIQAKILCFIDESDNNEENFINLQQLFEDYKIYDNKLDMIQIFHLFTNIANYHQRVPLFYNKILKVIKLFENAIKNYFTFTEIFNIFKGNKRIILFLIESELLLLDINMIEKMVSYPYNCMEYPSYFAPEIKSIINNDFRERHKYSDVLDKIDKRIPNYFYTKRREGVNDLELYQLIRKDDVKDFDDYVKLYKIDLNSLVKKSIYETNKFLINQQLKSECKYDTCNFNLIAYAAAVGSNKIFKHLMDNGVELHSSLWEFVISGNNLTVIKILEENKINYYLISITDSIKCHHNDIVKYLQPNVYNTFFLYDTLKFHNYMLINVDNLNNTSFYYLYKFDHPSFAKIILHNNDLNINQNVISNFI